MNTNKEQEEKQTPSQNLENQTSANTSKAAKNEEDPGEETFMGMKVENPAEQSEVGGEIYDIGMGGPGASSSGLRDRNTNDEDEDEE